MEHEIELLQEELPEGVLLKVILSLDSNVARKIAYKLLKSRVINYKQYKKIMSLIISNSKREI